MQTRTPNATDAQRGARLAQSAQRAFSGFFSSAEKAADCVNESTMFIMLILY